MTSVWHWFNYAVDAVVLGFIARWLLALLWTSQRRPGPVSGDPFLAAVLADFRHSRTRDVAVALVDLDAPTPVRTAFIGHADGERRFEIGSVTKGLTGMLVADGILRGELELDSQIGDILPAYAASEFGTLTVRELCSHTTGLPRLGGGLIDPVRSLPWTLLGLNPYRRVTPEALMRQASKLRISGRGAYRYSNLGGALAGALVAAAAGESYETLLAERIFAPLGMSASSVSRRGGTAAWGHTWAGQRRAPWILTGYSPSGGVLSTADDLGTLMVSLLAGTAPGARSLADLPDVATASPDRHAGLFWVIQRPGASNASRASSASSGPQAAWRNGGIWHNGGTGGYSAFLALFPQSRRGVVVLASVAKAAEQERIGLAVANLVTPAAGADPANR